MTPIVDLVPLMSEANSFALLAACTLFCLLATGLALAFAHVRSAMARDAIAGAAVLREGPALLVGVADTDGSPAVTVELTEQGTEQSHKGIWSTVWREIDRKVRATPFHVVTPSKERVLVEPREVFLVDTLKQTARPHESRRVRTAALTHGERVSVSGRLRRRTAAGGAYREGAGGWVLEPPAHGPMIIATEPLAAHHEGWARFHRRVALLPLVALLLVHGAAYAVFYDFVLHGRPVVGTVVVHETYPSTYQGHTTIHPRLVVEFDDTGTTVLLGREAYDHADLGRRVAAIETPRGAVSFGSEPGLSPVSPFGAAFVALSGIVIAVSMARQRRAWWERARVVEQVPGRLSDW